MATEHLTLDKNVRPMPLLVSSKVFIEEYEYCFEDRKRSTNYLYQLIIPFINNWERMLRFPGEAPDINLVSLLKMLDNDVAISIEMVERYVEIIDHISSVEQDLTLLFFNRLRLIKWMPHSNYPIMVEWVLAKDFKQYLRHRIVNMNRQKRNQQLPIDNPMNPDMIPVEHPMPDYLNLKQIQITDWEWYQIILIQLGLSIKETSRLTGMKINELTEERTALWSKVEKS